MCSGIRGSNRVRARARDGVSISLYVICKYVCICAEPLGDIQFAVVELSTSLEFESW